MVDTNVILQWFSEELVTRMEDKGITHRQLALNSRSMPHNIMGYIRGESFPSPWRLVLIAECLECTVDELLGYEDSGFNYRRQKERVFNKYPNEDLFTPYLRDKIIQRMRKMRMSEEELAERSGIKLQTIKKLLCVHSGAPQVPSLLRICDGFKCTPSELIEY